MAIDRQSVWVHKMHASYPDLHYGWNFVKASDVTTLIADGCAVPGHDDVRRLPHNNYGPAFTP